MWSLYFYADKHIYFIYTFCCFLLTESPVLADTNWLMIPFSWQKRWCLSAFTVLMCSRSTVDKKSSACNSHVFERKQKKASVYTLVKMVWICLMYEGRANKASYRWYVTSTSAAEATHCCDISHVEGVTQFFFFFMFETGNGNFCSLEFFFPAGMKGRRDTFLSAGLVQLHPGAMNLCLTRKTQPNPAAEKYLTNNTWMSKDLGRHSECECGWRKQFDVWVWRPFRWARRPQNWDCRLPADLLGAARWQHLPF